MVRVGTLRPLGSFVWRRFGTAATRWEGCRSVNELVGVVQSAGALDSAAVESLEQRAQQLLTGDLREATTLALVLHHVGGKAERLLAKVAAAPGDVDLDLFFRALAECGADSIPFSAKAAFAAPGAMEKPRQVYNYLCGACQLRARGAAVELDTLLDRLGEMGLAGFSSLQLLHMAAALAAVDVTAYEVLNGLCAEVARRGLGDAETTDVIEAMAKLSKHYQSPALLEAYEKALLAHCGEHALAPPDLCAVLYTWSRYLRCSGPLMDRLAVNLRRDAGSYDLAQLARAVMALSQVGYQNRPLVALLGRMVLTLLDADSTVDAQLLTNLYTGFSRFLHHERLFETFSAILRKEEVLAELQVSDAVAVVQSYARVHVVDERLFALLESKLFSQPLNTALSLKLLVAHGKLRHRSPRLQNALVNNVNLQELESSIDREVGRACVVEVV
ncbi:phosphoenolpyruvate synthase [Babesia caballi]|uniref:Phosphoenolpyruvate synthase n=1 Tax=Babesia caballi TaxID=5871 RepID=A0AAV4LQW5_BABCB|nr:phosphoenolpyruvate synthase [Babesia caballi]